MSHSFTLMLVDEMPSVIKRVESEIKDQGGIFNGNTECGSFAGKSVLGMVKGEYRCIAEDEIIITITDKPFLVPYGMVESEIRKYFTA